MSDIRELILRLSDKAVLCRKVGANDMAGLLEEAADVLERAVDLSEQWEDVSEDGLFASFSCVAGETLRKTLEGK